MAQTIARYNGSDITCYPGSNQTDDGKLNIEFNMARIVTRLSSKNFCIVKPSFEITIIKDSTTNISKLQIGTGEASINGMDLIMSSTLTIDPPEQPGTYHLAFRLARDSANNVLGDLIYGVTRTFEGVYLSYYEDKPDPVPADMLYLGKVKWDGEKFSSVIEDEDKYGRIWAEDILCKILDPKHPNITRLNLQEWLYKVPDWYVSKEGDVEYGEIEFLPGRDGLQVPGVKIQALTDNLSNVIVKAPSVNFSDVNRVATLKATDSYTSLIMGKSNINVDIANDYDLHIESENNIDIISKKNVVINGQDSVIIGSGIDNDTPKLTLQSNSAKLQSALNDLEVSTVFASQTTLNHIIGKAIWQYNKETSDIALLQSNVRYLDIVPDAIFRQTSRVIDKLYLGSDDGEQTFLSKLNWRLSSTTSDPCYIDFKPEILTMVNTLSNQNSAITVRNKADTSHTTLYDNGKIELLNSKDTPGIRFTDSNSTYNTSIYKVIGAQKLQISGALGVQGNISADGKVYGNGLVSTDGTLTLATTNGSSTLSRSANSDTLITSGGLNVGANSAGTLNAGNTYIKGTLSQGSSKQFNVDTNGNLTTSGTITGSKVYNAVYNDYAEYFKKDKNEIINPGDVVCIRDNGLVYKVSNRKDTDNIIGICSDTAGVLLGGIELEENEKVVIGMVGKLYVNTIDTTIKPGDWVKANEDGTVSKTTEKSNKLGIAMSNVENNKVRIVYNG